MISIKQLLARFTRKDESRQGNSRYYYIPTKGTAGVRIDHESAMTYSAVWRAIALISESIATLPWSVRERSINGRGQVVTEPLFTHPAATILGTSANPEIDSFQFRQALVAHALAWGNGYAEIVRDMSNRPVELWNIEPERVMLDRNSAGELFYIVRNGSNADAAIPAANMFHLRGPTYDGLIGYSVISYAARSIGLGIATEQFGADFFSNGATASGVLQHPERLGDEAIAHLKASVKETSGGNNRHAPMILEEGMTWKQISIPPEDAQFLETRKFNVSEIARWFNVPLHKLHEMDRSTFNNIEAQNIDFVTSSLMTWIRRLEMEANIKLVARQARGRVYTKINMNGLLRGDTAARGEWYKSMANLGVFSVNDILELEDRNPIGPEGDKRMVQMNLTTLEKVGEEPPPAAPAPGNAPAPPGDPEEGTANDKGAPAILCATIGKALARQAQRINDKLAKKPTLEDFAGYLEKFKADQAQYMENNLQPQIAAFGFKCDLAQFIDNHCSGMTVAAMASFTDDDDYQAPETEAVYSDLARGFTHED